MTEPSERCQTFCSPPACFLWEPRADNVELNRTVCWSSSCFCHETHRHSFCTTCESSRPDSRRPDPTQPRSTPPDQTGLHSTQRAWTRFQTDSIWNDVTTSLITNNRCRSFIKSTEHSGRIKFWLFVFPLELLLPDDCLDSISSIF